MKNVLKKLLPIIIPSLAIQIMEFGNVTIDSIMIGKYNSIAIGGVNIANSIFYLVSTFFIGIILMVGPLISQASGANNKNLVAQNLQSGVWLGIIFYITTITILSFTEELIQLFNIDKQTSMNLLNYMQCKKYTAFFLIMMPFRFFLTNQKIFKPIMILSLISMPINALLNFVLINGNSYIPEMGVFGAGIATMLSTGISMILIIITASYYAKKWNFKIWNKFYNINFKIIKRILKYGIPIGAVICIELLIFNIAAMFVTRLDAYSISAYAIYFQIYNIAFGIQLGITEGTNIFTSYQSGSKRYASIIKSKWITEIILISINSIIAIILLINPNIIYELFINLENTEDKIKIIDAMQSINIILLLSIFAEGYVQLPTRLLKSINNTKYLPIIQVFGYLIVGSIVMYTNTIIFDYGIKGIAFGILCGVLTTAIILNIRLKYIFKPKNIFNFIETK